MGSKTSKPTVFKREGGTKNSDTRHVSHLVGLKLLSSVTGLFLSSEFAEDQKGSKSDKE